MVELPDRREPLLERQGAATNLVVVSQDEAPHQKVLPDTECWEETPILRHVDNTRLEYLPWRQPLQGRPVKEYLAGLHCDEPTDGAQQRRLAGAVRADEAGHLVAGNVQRCATQDRAVPITGDDLADFEAGVH